MPDTTPIVPPPLPKSQPSFGKRHSTIFKLLGVGALVLVLLIALGGGSATFAQNGSAFFSTGNLVVSRTVYDNNPNILVRR